MPRYFLERLVAVCVLALLPCGAALAALSAVDDTGHNVVLQAPARRIVSLAPHTTEMLFAAGAGRYVVGVTEYSDYPPEAARIPSVGSGVSLDLERILQLKPDLIVGWNNGNAAGQLARLEALGVPVFKSEPYDFLTIASSIERLSHLTGTEKAGMAAAEAFRVRLRKLKADYLERRPLTVFYQIWESPLMTLNGQHIVSAALRLCRGDNIFAGLPQLAPAVSVEAVLQADPEVIIASTGAREDGFAKWRRFPQMKAVKNDNLISIDGELLNRPGPRILEGTEALCKRLDKARNKR